jgi:parallel beta-helix repeat protein
VAVTLSSALGSFPESSGMDADDKALHIEDGAPVRASITSIAHAIPVSWFASETNPLESAIAAGIAESRPVVLTYEVSVPDTITATAPFALFGHGPLARIVPTAATFNIFELTNSNDYSTFEGLTFVGKATSGATTQFCISQNGVTASPSGVTVRNVRIIPNAVGTEAANCGIKVYDAEDWLIEGLYVKNLWGQDLSNTGYGVLTGRSSRIHVNNSIFIGTTNRGRHAVYMTVDTNDSTISNNTVIGFKRSGIITKAGPTGEACSRNLIIGNKVLDYGSGVADQAAISIGGAAAGTRIIGNLVADSADDGINILPGDFTVGSGFTPGVLADITIAGNTLRNVAHLGIELQSTTRTRIKGNTFHNCGSGGSHATIGIRGDGNFGQGDDTGCRIMGNSFSSPGRASVEVSTSGTTPPSGLVIIGNDLATGSTGDSIRDITRPGIWELHNIVDGDADKVVSATVADMTPTVRNIRVLKVPSPGGASTLTALDDGVEGQTVEVHFQTGFITVDFTGTTLKGNGGVDWLAANGDIMRCTKQGANWYCSVHDCS